VTATTPGDGRPGSAGTVAGRPASSRPEPSHRPRPGGGSARRLIRTILFGSVAVILAIAWLVHELGLDADELLGYAVTSLALVAVVALFGMLAGGILWWVQRRWHRRERR